MACLRTKGSFCVTSGMGARDRAMIQGLIKEAQLLTCPNQPGTLAAGVGIKTWDGQENRMWAEHREEAPPPRGRGKAEALKKSEEGSGGGDRMQAGRAEAPERTKRW